ncbi:MAG: ammonium transporter [Thermoleophilia bacterium]|nr:ammonium transporter [Thermoleophilia bacterium]
MQPPWAWSPLAKATIKIVALAGLLLVLITGLAIAGDPSGSATGTATDVVAAQPGQPTITEIAAELGHVKISLNTFFLIFGGALVFFMQAGFALVETGFCRSKNAVHVIMTNFVIFALGTIAYWAVGYAFQFGGAGTFSTLGGTQPLDGLASVADGWGVIGHKGFFLSGKSYDVAILAMFFFQLVFMDTAATIPTGAMAERWKFSAFVVYGLFMAAIVYPIYGNWVWGGGWLSALGRNLGIGHGAIDFAGSGVVHAIGGFSALAGAMVLGPRIGKFGKDGKPRAILAHNIPLAIIGVIILVFGWIGFNGVSTLAATDLRFSVVIVNTFIASSAACLAAMFLVWKLWGKPDPSMTANGMLAGLVAITAPCAFVSPVGAFVIGVVAGLLVVGSIIFIERRLKVDDPVGAVSVHGVNGLWGLIALGLFADGSYGDGWNGVEGTVRGLFYGGGAGQLAAQAISAAVVAIWAFGLMYAFFRIQKKVQGIRVSKDEEMIGLDVPEMGVAAYPASPHL